MTGVTPNSVSLSWMVPDGQFDSFMVQYKDRDGQPQEVPVAADQREVTILDLDPARKYKMNFYGLHGRRRVGPLSVLAMTGEGGSQAAPSPGYPQTQPCLGLPSLSLCTGDYGPLRLTVMSPSQTPQTLGFCLRLGPSHTQWFPYLPSKPDPASHLASIPLFLPSLPSPDSSL